jgi:hypothetical protein
VQVAVQADTFVGSRAVTYSLALWGMGQGKPPTP